MKQEHILCAAIHYDDHRAYHDQPDGIILGYIVCGYRHDDIRSVMLQTIPGYSLNKEEYAPKENEGFLTSLNRFVGRIEALRIACNAMQVLKPFDLHRGAKLELSTEDLY